MGENRTSLDIMNKLHRDVCIELPPQVNSYGFWNNQKPNPDGVLRNSMPELELQMLMIFCMCQAFHFLLKRLGLQRLTSEIITGLVLGYALSDDKGNPKNEKLFTPDGQQIIGTMSVFGYALFLFLTAVKMNVGMVPKTGTKATTIAVVAILVPFLCGMAAKKLMGHGLTPSDEDKLPFVFITQSLVSFPVIASLLTELNILNSELGRLGLSAALVGDMISFAVSNSFLMVRVFMESKNRAIVDIAANVAFLLVVVFIFRPVMFLIIKQTPEGRPVKDVYVYSIIVLALACALYSDTFDEQVFLGPYILGLAIPDGPPLGSAITGKLDCFVNGVFLPLFVTTRMLRADFTKNMFDPLMKSSMILVVVTFVAKLAACVTCCIYYQMPIHDSWALAFIMTSKGIVDIAFYTYFRDRDGISIPTFNLLTISILAISVIVPICVKFMYDPSRKYAGYQKRNIMHLKPNSELRVLACIHRPDDIPAIIDLLHASCATKDNPIGVYVLHLIELIGRASPIFISHQYQKKSLSDVSYSQNVILSFNRFENSNWGTVKVNVFTAVSPYKLMHEDICTLALDKLTSLVILPFHRKWSMDGNVELEDNMVRALNLGVLERAPCSVAILVNRGYAGRAGSTVSLEAYMYSVCMIFLGGKDDREALTYAKRMCEGSKISLTVVHFAAPPDGSEVDEDKQWETMMDIEVLKDVKYSRLSARHRLTFLEKVVNDGSEMSTAVKGMVDEHDLIIAGRSHDTGCRQTVGLDLAWSEFPELGVIGDLLASKDIFGKASVLLVQQQTTDK